MTLPKYEHKTISIGASFPDYTVITQCIPDCPACASEATLCKVMGWGESECPHFVNQEKRECAKCWYELRREALEAK